MQLQHFERVPAYLRPPDQRFRWLTVEHADGSIREHCTTWPTDAELADMAARDVGYEEWLRDFNLWVWAQRLQEGALPGWPVVRVLDDWLGTVEEASQRVQARWAAAEGQVPPS